jgi:3-oxoacyl-[acyl-carrier-protein] synthase-3
MTIGIETIEYFLPRHIISSDELASRFGFQLPFVEEKIGVRKIYVAGEDERTSDLAVEAAKRIFAGRPDVKDKVGAIVVCTQTPDFQLPHTAALVQKKLGLRESVATFDLGLGCSGFVYGLSVLRSFMEENELEYGILITAETYSKIIDSNDKNTKPLFSSVLMEINMTV